MKHTIISSLLLGAALCASSYAFFQPSLAPEGKTETISVSGVSFDMVWVDAGTFKMGYDANRDGAAGSMMGQYTLHSVTLSSYAIGKHEVTQKLWKAVMGYLPPKDKNNCPDCPVSYLMVEEVELFIQKLNKLTGRTFRLPTEAEWEFAARGGNSSQGFRYAGSNNMNDVAWHNSNSGGKTHPVGQKKPNELGLYDMSGNVSELINDYYSDEYYTANPVTNPKGPSPSDWKVRRGDDWGGLDWSMPLYCRQKLGLQQELMGSGMRLVLVK